MQYTAERGGRGSVEREGVRGCGKGEGLFRVAFLCFAAGEVFTCAVFKYSFLYSSLF